MKSITRDIHLRSKQNYKNDKEKRCLGNCTKIIPFNREDVFRNRCAKITRSISCPTVSFFTLRRGFDEGKDCDPCSRGKYKHTHKKNQNHLGSQEHFLSSCVLDEKFKFALLSSPTVKITGTL